MKKLLSLLLVICLVGCTHTQQITENNSSVGTCRLTITAGETSLLDSDVTILEGDTVLSILQRTANANELPIMLSGQGAQAYVIGIAEYTAGAKGSMSGWVYEINESPVFTAAGDTSVKNEDRVEWKYITEFTQ